MIKPLTIISTALLLTACAAWFPPTSADSHTNHTDGSQTITTAPQFIECVRMPPCAYVAYTWNSTQHKESVLNFIIDDLQTAANGYRTLDSITLTIDGDTVALKPYAKVSHSSDEIYVKTHHSYTAPLSLLYRIERSAHTDIKIVTDTGVIQANFKESRAFLGLLNFNKKLAKTKS